MSRSRTRTATPAAPAATATDPTDPTVTGEQEQEQEQEPTGEQEQEPTGDAADAEPTGPTPAETFRAAVDAAIAVAESDPTGTVPAVNVDAVLASVRGLKGTERRDLPTATLSALIAANMPPAPDGKLSIAAAASRLLTAIAEMPTAKGAAKPATPADPIGDIAANIATFRVTETMLTANLSDADRDAVAERVDAILANADGFVAVWPRGIGSRGKGAAKPATGDATPRKTGGSVSEHVLAVLRDAEPGAVLRVSQIAGVKRDGYAPSAGAINAALDRGIAGVELTTVPGAAGKATRAVRLAATA